MSFAPVRHLLTTDNLDKLIGKVTFVARIALVICIFLSAVTLTVASFTNGEANSQTNAFFFFLAFYSFIWGTLPTMIVLIALALDNKYRKKVRLQPLKTEGKLLGVNIVIILITVVIIGLFRLSEQ